MSIKNFAYLTLRRHGLTPRQAKSVLDAAILGSCLGTTNFEQCVNIGAALLGLPDVFSALQIQLQNG